MHQQNMNPVGLIHPSVAGAPSLPGWHVRRDVRALCAAIAWVALPVVSMQAVAQTVHRAPIAATSPTTTPIHQTPRVVAFDVRSIDRIVPGSELEFTVWGTPGAQASLSIDGAQRTLLLRETSNGVYQGVYVIAERDRIAPDARVTANLRVGNQVHTALLDEPIQRGYTAPVATGGDMPKIDRLTVTHGGERQRVGAPIHVTLIGTPGGRAVARLPGASDRSSDRRVLLREVRPGEYIGTYTIRAEDQLRADEPVTARLRVGDRTVTAQLDNALDRARLQAVADPVLCAACAKVMEINRIEVDGDGNYIGGTVAGGVLGAILGSQVGKGDGRTAAGVVGAVGGALIGREIEKRQTRNEVFEVVLRMADGSRQTVTYEDRPTLKVGDTVRVVNGALQVERT